jgi:hypothetical protein
MRWLQYLMGVTSNLPNLFGNKSFIGVEIQDQAAVNKNESRDVALVSFRTNTMCNCKHHYFKIIHHYFKISRLHPTSSFNTTSHLACIIQKEQTQNSIKSHQPGSTTTKLTNYNKFCQITGKQWAFLCISRWAKELIHLQRIIYHGMAASTDTITTTLSTT